MTTRARLAELQEAKLANRRDRLASRAGAIGATLVERPTNSRAKFHNVKAVYRGMRFDSTGEAEYAAHLDLRVKAGELVDWEQPKPIVLLNAPKARDRVTYKPDFFVIPREGYAFYVDYKGSGITETQAWRIKVKLWKQHVPFELRVAKPVKVKKGELPQFEERVVATGNEALQEKLAGA